MALKAPNFSMSIQVSNAVPVDSVDFSKQSVKKILASMKKAKKKNSEKPGTFTKLDVSSGATKCFSVSDARMANHYSSEHAKSSPKTVTQNKYKTGRVAKTSETMLRKSSAVEKSQKKVTRKCASKEKSRGKAPRSGSMVTNAKETHDPSLIIDLIQSVSNRISNCSTERKDVGLCHKESDHTNLSVISGSVGSPLPCKAEVILPEHNLEENIKSTLKKVARERNEHNVIDIEIGSSNVELSSAEASEAAISAAAASTAAVDADPPMYLVQLKHPLSEISTADSNISAIQMDFENLLGIFKESESVRYEQFAQIWRDLRMAHIFSGKQTDKECSEFTEECLQVALSFYVSNQSFQIRVGGLYLLYAVYNKQISSPPVKIRVTLAQWKEMLSFQEDACSQEHYDVDYIFSWLKEKRAFHFTLIPASLPTKFFGNQGKHDRGLKESYVSENAETLSVVPELLSGSIDLLSSVHEQYHQMKCGLVGPESATPSLSLNVIQSDLVQGITKAVTNFEDWRKYKARRKTLLRRKDSGVTTTSESELDTDNDEFEQYGANSVRKSHATRRTRSVGLTRAEIKARAYSDAAPVTRSRRHRQNKTAPATSSPARKKMKPADDCSSNSGDSANNEQNEGTCLSMPNFTEDENMPAISSDQNIPSIKGEISPQTCNTESGSSQKRRSTRPQKKKRWP